MNVLEKILNYIDRQKRVCLEIDNGEEFNAGALDMANSIKDFIRKRMDECKTFEFDFNRVKSFDCRCGRHYVNTCNDGWISVDERLPEETDYYLVQLSRKLPNEDYSDRVVVLFNGEEKEFECYANLIIAWHPLPERYKGGDDRA